jgi:ribosomal protein S18
MECQNIIKDGITTISPKQQYNTNEAIKACKF